MTKVDPKMMTQAEYSRHRGCSREAVRQAIEGGRIMAFGPEKLIDATLADAQWQRNTRARTPGVNARAAAATAAPAADEAPTESYSAWRCRREAAEAQAAELRLAEERGQLIRVDAIRAAYARRLVVARERLNNIPGRLAPLVAVESDPAAVHALLMAEVRAALDEIAQASVDLH